MLTFPSKLLKGIQRELHYFPQEKYLAFFTLAVQELAHYQALAHAEFSLSELSIKGFLNYKLYLLLLEGSPKPYS